MHLISSVKIYDSITEKYKLDDLYNCDPQIRDGALICYLIASKDDVELISMYASDDETGYFATNQVGISKEEFEQGIRCADDLEAAFTEGYPLYVWDMNIRYRGKDAHLSGFLSEPLVWAASARDDHVQISELLRAVEGKSIDGAAKIDTSIFRMKQAMGSGIRQALELEKHLKKTPPVWDEFLECLTADGICFKEDGIKVEGYTAKSIHEVFGASPILSYYLLARLCEDPAQAFAEMTDGVPMFLL